MKNRQCSIYASCVYICLFCRLLLPLLLCYHRMLVLCGFSNEYPILLRLLRLTIDAMCSFLDTSSHGSWNQLCLCHAPQPHKPDASDVTAVSQSTGDKLLGLFHSSMMQSLLPVYHYLIEILCLDRCNDAAT